MVSVYSALMWCLFKNNCAQSHYHKLLIAPCWSRAHEGVNVVLQLVVVLLNESPRTQVPRSILAVLHFLELVWRPVSEIFITQFVAIDPLSSINSAGAVFVQLEQKKSNLQILKIFTTSSEIMNRNKTVKTSLSCSAIIYFSKQLWKYFFLLVVAQQQWVCALLSNRVSLANRPSQLHCVTPPLPAHQ